jgi:hypothetical protein
MKHFVLTLGALAAAVSLALITVPLALADPLSGNKPTVGSCPKDSTWGNPVLVSSISDPDANAAAALSDVNQDGYVCEKTVSAKSNGVGPGPSFIDNTAHNQNG